MKNGAPTLDAGTTEILLTELQQLHRTKFGQDGGIARGVLGFMLTAQVPRDFDYVGKFRGAVDLGVAGQYLFHQSRPRARQADDEYRCGIQAPISRIARE